MKYCKIVLDKKGKKQVDFGKKWGAMPKSKANAMFMKTGNGMYVIDFDFKKVKKAPKHIRAFIESLKGFPTVETARGFHVYVKSDVPMANHQNIFKDKKWGVDIRGEGGLIFTDYWGKEKGISYIKTGKPIKDPKGKIFKRLPKHIREPRERPTEERSEVGLAKKADIKRMLSKINVKDFRDRDTWMGVIASVYHGLGDKGEKLARKWSQGDKKNYDEKSFNNIWKQCVRGSFGESITVGSLKRHAGEVQEEDIFKPVSKKDLKKAKSNVEKIKELIKKEKASWEAKNPHFAQKKYDWMRNEMLDAQALYAYLENSCWDSKRQRIIWVSSSSIVREVTRQDVRALFEVRAKVSKFEMDGMIAHWEMTNSAEIEDFWKSTFKAMVTYLVKNKQIITIEREVDPFSKVPSSVKHCPYVKKMSVVSNNYIPDTPKKPKNKKKYKAFVADYKEHFPELDDFIDVGTSMRFGADKKMAYLWLQADSNWGKSFLFGGVFKRLGLVTNIKEKELKKAMGGDPVGMNAEDFTNSWFLVFEEFKGAVSELKDITHELQLSPKQMSRTTVKLYGKIFLSAENVKSLVDERGADKQFSNRFMHMKATGSLVDRKLYAGDQVGYLEAITYYVYKRLMKQALMYIKLGERKAAIQANATLQKFRKKYPLGGHGVTTDIMDTNHEQVMRHNKALAQAFETSSNFDNPQLDMYMPFVDEIKMWAVKDKHENIIINNLDLAYNFFVKHVYAGKLPPNLVQKIRPELMNLEPKKTHRIGGDVFSGYKLYLV